MSARDVIAKVIHPYFKPARADRILSALTSSGYRILVLGDIDPATVEKCAEVAEERAEWVPLKAGDMRTAIRALCATHQGDK